MFPSPLWGRRSTTPFRAFPVFALSVRPSSIFLPVAVSSPPCRGFPRLCAAIPPARTSSRAPSRRDLSTTSPRCPSHLGVSFPSCPCRSSSLRAAPRLFLSSFGEPAPGGLPRPAACAAGRLASPAADSAGPRADAGSTSSKPWGRGTLPAGEGPRRETQGEVLITVDGAPLDGGCRWRSGTPRRRDRRGATAGQDRSSSRWRSCWQELMRRRPSGSTSRSRGASSRRSRRSAGRWTPATSSVGSKSAAASDGQRRAPGGGRELCAPAAWGRNASARRLYVPPVYADRAGPRKPCLSGFWGSRFLPVMRGARRGRSAPAVSWQRRVRRSTAGRHAGAHPDVDVRALGCLAVGSRPRARSVGGPARPATRARRGAIVVLQHAGRSAARGCSWCGEAGCWCRWGPDRR